MYTVFNLLEGVNSPVMYPQNWNTVREVLKGNLQRTIRYYRRNPTAVESDHLLVRTLQSITVPQSLELDRYYWNVDSMAMNHSMALGMTSSISAGHVFDGVFFGKGSREIVIAHDTGFDFNNIAANWENATPVKVLRHASTDLGIPIPDGSVSTPGFAVILINIPMLAVQYREFRRREQLITAISEDSQRTLMHFIRMYVLPNMLFSILDTTLFNRIHNLSRGIENDKQGRWHSFHLNDYTSKVDDVHQTILSNLSNVTRNFTGISRNVPLVTKKDLDELMTFPDMVPTNQVIWGLVIGSLPPIDFIARVSGDTMRAKNQNVINQIRRALQSYRSNNLFRTRLGTSDNTIIQQEINEIIRLITA